MLMRIVRRLFLLIGTLAVIASVPPALFAQAPAPSAPRMESIQELTSRLSPEQKQQFDDAMRSFDSQRYSEALPVFKQLLQQLQGDAFLTKVASEAALNTGDAGYAGSALRPLAAANPNDWQAAALLARACAESGDKGCRDAQMAHMIDLQRQGVTPQGLKQYIVERVPAGDNTLVIQASLQPWGRFNIYDMGQVVDKQGRTVLRITLESDEGDQALFASEHPNEAAAGLRRFSYDGYRDNAANAGGQRTQTHYTYKLLVGQPTYESVREEFISIAKGQGEPATSSTH